jgi:hypothetical protein
MTRRQSKLLERGVSVLTTSEMLPQSQISLSNLDYLISANLACTPVDESRGHVLSRDRGATHLSNHPKSSDVPTSPVHLIMFCATTAHLNAANRVGPRALARPDYRDHQSPRVSSSRPPSGRSPSHLVKPQTRSDTQHAISPVSRCTPALSMDPSKPSLASRWPHRHAEFATAAP